MYSTHLSHKCFFNLYGYCNLTIIQINIVSVRDWIVHFTGSSCLRYVTFNCIQFQVFQIPKMYASSAFLFIYFIKTVKVVTDYGKDIQDYNRHSCILMWKIKHERHSHSWITFLMISCHFERCWHYCDCLIYLICLACWFIFLKTVKVVTGHGKDIQYFNEKIRHSHSWITFLMIPHHF